MTSKAKAVRIESRRRYGFGTERMQELKICEYCGTMTESTKKFCPACARLLPRDTVYTQYLKRHRCCGYCGKVVSKAMQFCPDCGQRLLYEHL